VEGAWLICDDIARGMQRDAQRVYHEFMDNTDDFPRSGTGWYRSWI
jgi:hypothetical protein